jgi:chromate transport protein ChrA
LLKNSSGSDSDSVGKLVSWFAIAVVVVVAKVTIRVGEDVVGADRVACVVEIMVAGFGFDMGAD